MTITRRYTVAGAGLDPATLPAGWEEDGSKLASAFVRAAKPATSEKMQSKAAQRLTTLPVSASSGGCCGSQGCACG
ncbi:MAG TPA: hypothetical protein VGP82_14810 [Ktedonobacterales bacterium]|nr:hypothetical protein [Ktedonobacterales bacterium]